MTVIFQGNLGLFFGVFGFGVRDQTSCKHICTHKHVQCYCACFILEQTDNEHHKDGPRESFGVYLHEQK